MKHTHFHLYLYLHSKKKAQIYISDYNCTGCDTGYTGKRCEKPIDLCQSAKPCQNGATCLAKVNGYFCVCPPGYTDDNCSVKVELECIRNKGENGAICIPNRLQFPGTESSGYSCECSDEYEGKYCEKQKDLCRNVQCDYGYFCF